MFGEWAKQSARAAEATLHKDTAAEVLLAIQVVTVVKRAASARESWLVARSLIPTSTSQRALLLLSTHSNWPMACSSK
jgi:hypothetical protein